MSSTDLSRSAADRYARFEGGALRRLFVALADRLNPSAMARQRIKMLYFGSAYWRLFTIPDVPAFRLLRQFWRVDWNVVHGHLPSETVSITRTLASRRAKPGEVVVEAGCWKGGSSAKFSLLCEMFGYRLEVYDSFEGVETLSGEDAAKEWDYAGQYASPEEALWSNLRAYGSPNVCASHKGWFSDTLARNPIKSPVRMAYIDCDLGKGTYEALQGVVESLTPDAVVYTQDFHITPVRDVLLDPQTWESLGKPMPRISQEGVYLARLEWDDEKMTSGR